MSQIQDPSLQRRNLYIIYAMNFLWCLTTVMVTTTLSIYHEHFLHITKMQIGSIQAYAVFSMYVAKFMSGLVVDIFKNHKIVIFTGSFLSTILKPLYAFTTSVYSIFALRSLERISMGLRMAPTDALVSLTASSQTVGKALAHKLVAYTAGGLVGCVLTSAVLTYSNNNFRLLYFITAIPSLVAVVLPLFLTSTMVVKNKVTYAKRSEKYAFHFQQIKQLPRILYVIYFLAFGVTAARCAENFMGHRYHELGLAFNHLPLIYLLHDVPFFIASIYFAKIFDRMNWKNVLLMVLVLLGFSNFFFLISDSLFGLVAASICGGIQYAITLGLFLTIISKYTNTHVRGTAFGIYQVIAGLGLFVSNKLTGIFAQAFDTWKAGFLGQTIIAVVMIFFVIIFLRGQDCHAVEQVEENETII